MADASLSLVREGDEPLIQVFVHGFLNGANGNYNELYDQLLAARPAGRVYLFHWPSGSLGPFSAPTFPWKQRDAEEYGKRLRVHLGKVPGARALPLNLIGHSLGARLIHWALAHYDWSSYNLQNVVLMGSAASREDDDWRQCADAVRGTLVNAWSDADWILKAKLFDSPAGLKRLRVRHPSIRNVKTSLGHLDYWDNLEWVLQRSLRDRFHQYKKDAIASECPFCGLRDELEPGRYRCDFRRGGCGMYYEVSDDGCTYPVENRIRCRERGCGCVAVVDVATHTLVCPDCGAVLWQSGARIPPGRQLTESA